MKVVVDTNVPIVTNGQSEQASPECVAHCAQRIKRVSDDHDRLVLDNEWRIIKEYKAHLNSAGQPGIGDAFLRWVLTNLSNPNRCELIQITSNDNDETDFQEFPATSALKDFDRSDRKFVAVALAHPEKPPILQAVDSKWLMFKEALEQAGVVVEFLCSAPSENTHSPITRVQPKAKTNRRRKG